jgi:hypothetical protein
VTCLAPGSAPLPGVSSGPPDAAVEKERSICKYIYIYMYMNIYMYIYIYIHIIYRL